MLDADSWITNAHSVFDATIDSPTQEEQADEDSEAEARTTKASGGNNALLFSSQATQ